MNVESVVQDVLDQHHTLLHREVSVLDAGLQAHTADPALLAPWGALVHLLGEHLFKEERILFPALLHGASLPCGLDGPISQMRHEHREIDRLETQLRAASGAAGPHEAKLLWLLDDLAVHAGKEEALFDHLVGPEDGGGTED